jgi:hypothetical protein
LTVAGTATNNVTCNGGNDGSFTVTPAGGSGGAYGYSTNGVNYQSSGTFSGLPAGVYSVTITNGAGCTASTSVTVSEPTVLTVAGTATNNVTVYGGSNGSFTVTASGGSPSGTQYFSTNNLVWQTSGTFSGLTAGVYTVSVTNSADTCPPISTTVTVTQPSALTANPVTVSRNLGQGLHISVTNILGQVTHAPGDTIYLKSVGSSSGSADNLTTGGITLTVVSNSSAYWINYTNKVPDSTNADLFYFTVTNQLGATSSSTVTVTVVDTFQSNPIVGQVTTNLSGSIGFKVKYFGVPGYYYVVQRSHDLTSWVSLKTNLMIVPPAIYTDTNPTTPAYYRVAWKP